MPFLKLSFYFFLLFSELLPQKFFSFFLSFFCSVEMKRNLPDRLPCVQTREVQVQHEFPIVAVTNYHELGG